MRSECDRAEGYFSVPFKGGEVRLRELSWGDASEWARVSATSFGPVFDAYERDWKPGDGLLPVEMANRAAMEAMIERIVAYDVDGVLGGDVALRRLRPAQIKDLYQELYEAAHPFAGDLLTALTQMATQRVSAVLAARSAGASSTNGRSRRGASPRAASKPVSPRASSNSSGTKARSGPAAKPRHGSVSSTSPSAMPSRRPTSTPASGQPAVAT